MTKKQWANSILLLLVGTFLFGFAVAVFIEPMRLNGGGFSGVSLIIHYFIPKISVGVGTFILNIPFFIIAFKNVGKRFFILSLVGMFLYSIAIDFFMKFQTELIEFFGTPDMTLSTIYAGLLGGIGTGFVVRSGGSTGGSDLLGGIINRKHPNMSIAQVMMMFDLCVVVVNSFVFNDFSLALYSIISILMVGLVLDFIVDGFKECRAYYIISEMAEEISAEILQKLNRGATAISAKGMYTKKDKNMILVLIKKRQQTELRNIIKRVDPTAFMFAISAKEVLGEGFNALDPKEKPLAKTKTPE